MLDLRKAAVPALVLVGGALLAGCGDSATDDEGGTTTEPTMEESMAPSP